MPGGNGSRRRTLFRHIPGHLCLVLFTAAAAFLFAVLSPLSSRAAEDISAAAEFTYVTSNIETTNNDTGDTTGTDFTSLDQTYNLGLSRQLYPFLTLNAGGTFETKRSESTSEELNLIRKDETIRPYVDLEFRSPLYSMGIGYNKNRLRNEISDLSVTKDFQESVDFSFTYKPADLPLLRIFHTQAHTYNDPLTSDTVSKQTTVKATYSFNLNPVSYTYVRDETDDKMVDVKVVRETHEGTAGYTRSFFNNRVTMDTRYRIRLNISTVPENAVLETPISATEGLYSADNTPLTGPRLTALTSLIDGDKTSSTGINIGWAESGNPDRNIGLDFGFALNVDRIRVYVDRNVSSSAANSFSWSIYTSPDNTDTSVWTLHATVFPASFTIFQNRFEIPFPEVSTQFIKVVVTPLSSAFIGDSELQNINVTEIEALITDAVTRDREITDTDQNVSFSLAGRVSDRTRVGYNLLHSRKKSDADPAPGRLTWSNSIYLNHIFNRIFTGSARVSRDDSKSTIDNDTISKRRTYDYSANLQAGYLDTLSQTLTWGYTDIKEDQERRTTSSVFLRTNAALYKGWDAFIDIGYSWEEPPDAGRTNSTFLTAQTSVVPNREISLDATYSMVKSKDEEAETTNTKHTYDARASYFPYRNLAFSFQITIEEETQKDSREVLQRYTANWSPFRDGDLQLNVSYTETQRPSDDQQERTMGPVLRWDINRYASLDVGYFITTTETVLETTDQSTITSNLNMTF